MSPATRDGPATTARNAASRAAGPSHDPDAIIRDGPPSPITPRARSKKPLRARSGAASPRGAKGPTATGPIDQGQRPARALHTPLPEHEKNAWTSGLLGNLRQGSRDR